MRKGWARTTIGWRSAPCRKLLVGRHVFLLFVVQELRPPVGNLLGRLLPEQQLLESGGDERIIEYPEIFEVGRRRHEHVLLGVIELFEPAPELLGLEILVLLGALMDWQH